MAFFCLPIFFGCPTKIHADGDPSPRICPRCNNASVISAKSRTWFELCFVPLIPFKAKNIWICGICQWNVPYQQGWEPARPGHHFTPGYQAGPQGQGPTSPPAHPGYQPTYLNQK